MSETLLTCLEDPAQLWARRVCLDPVSKDLRGEMRLLDRERQECDDRCLTLKTDHVLKLEVLSHERCDSEVGRRLDGTLFVRRLVTALAGGTGEGRGLHTGAFRWVGDGVLVEGRLSGMTNVGTHREPAFRDCQVCHDPGYMEGRLCGRVLRSKDEKLVGCEVTAAYRLRFEHSEGFEDTRVEGTLEGLVVCSCGKDGGCLDLASFPVGSHANPWTVGGHTFTVSDHTGTPTASTEVLTWGTTTGLNAGYHTRIDLGAPATTGIDITLAHFASPATVTALDGTGAVVDVATMTVAGSPETLHLSGAITTLVVEPPNDETLILQVCVR
jgi:hypothetical protein